MNDRAATQVVEEEHEDLSKPNAKRLHEVAGPRHVVPQKRGPVLSVEAGPSTARLGSVGGLGLVRREVLRNLSHTSPNEI